jgi:hypothetical protein
MLRRGLWEFLGISCGRSIRFGGWYITGSTGKTKHMGNVLASDPEQPEKLDFENNRNWTTLATHFEPGKYPAPHSDVVAHLVLAHQTAGHNYIARVSYEARTAIYMQKAINRSLKETEDAFSESTERRLDRAAEILLRYMLFADEQKLPAPVRGNSEFVREFAQAGVKDRKGRSLREFDLETRIFRYPLSFLIYSEAFDALPETIRTRFYSKLDKALRAPDGSLGLSGAQREAIREIVLDTKPEARKRWKLPQRQQQP